MNTVPFRMADMVRGDDGELYHLPTLRRLFAQGRLAATSSGYRLLLAAEPRDLRHFN